MKATLRHGKSNGLGTPEIVRRSSPISRGKAPSLAGLYLRFMSPLRYATGTRHKCTAQQR